MDFIKLSDDMLAAARDYVPAAEKKAFVDECAAKCIVKISIAVDPETDDGYSVPMPDFYKEDYLLMHRYLMGAFVELYLGQDFDPVDGENYLMSQDDFDRWSGGHIFNQIDRMKRKGSNDSIKDKCYDILEDYANLRRMFYNEVRDLVNVMVDPCQRIMAMMTMQTTPEAIEKGQAELAQLMGMVEQLKGKQGGDTDAESAV